MFKNSPNRFAQKWLLLGWQGLYAFIVNLCWISLLFCTCAAPGFAGQAQVLSDTDLDQVYAEGIFFDFNVSFGNINDLLGKTGQSATETSTQNSVQQGSNSNVTILNPTSPTAPTQPISPTAVAGQSTNTSVSQNTADTGVASVSSPTVSIPLDIPGGNIAQSVLQTGTNLTDTSNYTGNAATASIVTPTTTSLVDIAPTGSNTTNTVVVSDLSQQYLSALVNVNAAGSVVPVLLNITININSTVGSVQNNNSLNLQNYYRVNVR